MTLAIHMKRMDAWAGYMAWCPALPGCRVFARTRREARDKIGTAVRSYLDRLAETLPRELLRAFRHDRDRPAA